MYRNIKIPIRKLVEKKYRVLLMILFCCIFHSAYSQKIALKTNAVLWATVSPNLSAEFVVSHNMSVDLSASFNVWSPYNGIKMDHVSVSPEVRYWFQRPMAQHFLGVTLLYMNYDMGYKGTLYDGQALGGGITYGYNFVLGKHWNLELTAGVGAMFHWQYRYKEEEQRPLDYNNFGWNAVPVKLGVNISYVIF